MGRYMSNEHKMAFIMCVNDPQAEAEAKYYISRLMIPDGMIVEFQSIYDAKSMTEGYNRAMKNTDAKYKVYMHQDVMIINENFISDILCIFKDARIGMVGMVGTPKLPENGIMWLGDRVGGLYTHNYSYTRKVIMDNASEGMIFSAEAIDGFLMATQYDIPWREDVFTGWDYYDVSQSFEFRKAGYMVAVPYCDPPWCMHDDGGQNLENYFMTRKTFLREYRDI